MIRLATRADAPGIHSIYAPIVRDTMISFELEPPDVATIERRIEDTLAKYPWLVYEDGEGIAGYVYANPTAPRPLPQLAKEAAQAALAAP